MHVITRLWAARLYVCLGLVGALVLVNAGFRSVSSLDAAPLITSTAGPAWMSALGALTIRAKTEGSIRLIVQLNVPFQPEGQLRDQERQSQRAKIHQAQQALTNRLGSTKAHHDFSTIPFLMLEVNAAQLAALAAAPDVVDITEDRVMNISLDISNPLVGAPAAWSAGARGNGQTVPCSIQGSTKAILFSPAKSCQRPATRQPVLSTQA